MFNGFCSQAEKGSCYLKHAMFAFRKPVPVDAAAREELLVRSLYQVMKEENFNEAYRMVVDKSAQGDVAGQ